MEPNIFKNRDELLRNTSIQVKDIPERKFVLPPTEDPALGFKPLKPDVIPNEAKPVILENHPVKKDIVPFNLAERQGQIAADQMNKERADKILVDSRDPELLRAKLKKLEEADIDSKMMKLDALIKAYELRSLASVPKVADSGSLNVKPEAANEPDEFELEEEDLAPDAEEQKYPSRSNIPHIDEDKLRNVHYGLVVPPGAKPGYTARELDQIIADLNSEDFNIKKSGNKTEKADNIMRAINENRDDMEIQIRLGTTFGGPSRIPTFLNKPVTPQKPQRDPYGPSTPIPRKKEGQGKFLQFGNMLVDKKKLIDKGVLSVNEWSKTKNLPVKVNKFKNRPISEEMRDSIIYILNKGIVPDLSDLSQGEKEYLYQIIGRSRIELKDVTEKQMKMIREQHVKVADSVNSKYRNKSVENIKNRFAVLMGEIQAGNTNNPEIEREMKNVLLALVRHKVISTEESKDLKNRLFS